MFSRHLKNENEPPIYYSHGKRWNTYEYNGVVGIQAISRKFKIPIPRLIARLKTGLSIQQAIAHELENEKERAYQYINFSEIVAKMAPMEYRKNDEKAVKIEVCTEVNRPEPEIVYTMKIYEKGRTITAPEELSQLWRLALGLPSQANQV
ncbi:hypothetical protein [Vibrio scophthalmi]|uniref:Uncharacterized protein n=1 Tax=Vibrio scophthalmi LMG 19158 TaxID=870967 RepID=F9RIC8_9VIBR|nr:hypothetical protein [Vibrio scophthalmi]EGU42460.1 hypothetical protein VIS19158_11703 [Vibrio scophthalmi LMG 19158]